ncbi:MAG: hypothetical protein AAF533_27595 [Acidobacteriota bacterium]
MSDVSPEPKSSSGLMIMLAVVLTIAVLGRLALGSWGVEAVGAVLRGTARSSGLLGGLAFLAPALVRLWPRSSTRWLARREDALILLFTWSQLLHLGAIGLGYRLGSLTEKETSDSFVQLGILVYLVNLVVAGLSLPIANTLRQRKLGRRAHAAGMVFLWAAFAVSWARHAPDGWLPITLTLLSLVALGLRIGAWLRAR